jgi:signal transduction histidine kinase
LALMPLRQGVQAFLERRLYGLRSRPYELVSTLGRRIGLALTPEQTLAAAVAAIGEGLNAPFAGIELGENATPEATHGRARPWAATTLTLTHRGQPIGRLVVQQRGPDEPWTRREQALLQGLAHQLGPTAASVRLTRELQAARERLVRAREEELRRLQRDLHDGVGPTLAGARMLVRSARTAAGQGSNGGLLDELDTTLGDATTEIRRILDNLRPPALDRGLPAALDTAVRRYRSADFAVLLSTHGDLDDLPAAVEVVTYRVVDEALTNVVKHAHAGGATVTVTRSVDRLLVEVCDDGLGPGLPRADGVGLDSMRERCQELGGSFEIAPASAGTRHPGTRISAGLLLS